MTVAPSSSLHVQTTHIPRDISKLSALLPPSPLSPGSTISTMPSVLNLDGTKHQPSAHSLAEEAEDESVIDISSSGMPEPEHIQILHGRHEDAAPHLHQQTEEGEERAVADHHTPRASSDGGPSSPTPRLGLQCAPPVILPPSPPLTVADPREGAGEASTSAFGAAAAASSSSAAHHSQNEANDVKDPLRMQEEDITNWRASMGGGGARGGEETRQEVLEEETEGDLEGEYDPYDLGYSPVTPISPSGPVNGRAGEPSRTSGIHQTSDHPLRNDVPAPSPPLWEVIGPPETRNAGAEQRSVGRPPSRRPKIPHSAYYFGPPPLDSAYHTEPIGQIGLHHPREIIRVERDYSGGELVQFSATYPLELEGRITPTQFLETINAINEHLISAHSLGWSCVDNALSFFTLQLSRLFVKSHYDREMRRLQKLIDEINTTLYNPAGLNILWPRNVAFMFLEIEYY